MRKLFFVTCLTLCLTAGCSVFDSEQEEQEIALSQVPANVLQAAQNAVDGITITEAEMETEDGKTVYVIEGTAQGTEYEIEVTTDGKVIEVEKEDDDDQDNDDQEDND